MRVSLLGLMDTFAVFSNLSRSFALHFILFKAWASDLAVVVQSKLLMTTLSNLMTSPIYRQVYVDTGSGPIIVFPIPKIG